VLVGVSVGVLVGVGVQARRFGEFVVLPDTGLLILVSVPLALTLSVKKASDPPQGGAVSSMLPVQVSVAVPLSPSVVTGLPPWLQGTATVAPPGKGTWLVTSRLMTVPALSRF
jgi:hypothetical protein